MRFRSVAMLVPLVCACMLWSVQTHATDQDKEDTAQRQKQAEKDIVITDATMEVVSSAAHVAAVYFTLQNKGDTTYLITGVTSDICPKIVGHHSDQESTPGTLDLFTHLSVPAHTTLVFPHGGYHLLCLNMTSDPHDGQAIPFTFTFLEGVRKTVTIPVGRTANPI